MIFSFRPLLRRSGRGDRRLHRVDADRVRQVDRAARTLELDERQIDAVGHELPGRVAPVPAHVHVRRAGTGPEPPSPRSSRREPRCVSRSARRSEKSMFATADVAAADRREDLVDAGLGDRARFELEALRHREGRRGRDEQQQRQDRRGVPSSSGRDCTPRIPVASQTTNAIEPDAEPDRDHVARRRHVQELDAAEREHTGETEPQRVLRDLQREPARDPDSRESSRAGASPWRAGRHCPARDGRSRRPRAARLRGRCPFRRSSRW